MCIFCTLSKVSGTQSTESTLQLCMVTLHCSLLPVLQGLSLQHISRFATLFYDEAHFCQNFESKFFLLVLKDKFWAGVYTVNIFLI